MLFDRLLFGCLLYFSIGYGSNGAEVTEQETNKYAVYQTQLTWIEAFYFCQQKNMKLAETLTYRELNTLRKYIRSKKLLPSSSNAGYWLGGKLDNSFIWRWNLKNEPINNNFMAGWHFGHPIRKDFIIAPYECMELQYKNNSELISSLSWNDISCGEKRGVVCEVWNEYPEDN